MAPLPRFLLWLDLETTSLDPANTSVLEAFWELTDWNLAPVASGHGVRRCVGDGALPPMDDFVREMHAKSGLIDACLDGTVAPPVGGAAGTMARLARLLDGIDVDVPLAGSGVSHFDRLVLAEQYPDVASRLTYWSLDLGPIRRLAEGTGYADLALPAVDIAHRAEADVRRAQAEYRQWRAVFDIARDATAEGTR